MRGHRRIGLVTIILALGVAGGMAASLCGAPRSIRSRAIRIGMINTLFRDVPGPMVKASMGPFRALMESQTGLRGEMITTTDAYTLGQQLTADRVQLGVFHGFEFAWARQKYPKLRPLMLVVNQQRYLRAHLFVRKDSDAIGWESLKGRTLALPQRSREHCLLYLERTCGKEGSDYRHYFSQIATPSSVEDALDDVVDGQAQVALVDGVSLRCYKRRKPTRFAKLKEIGKSCLFPAAVVAYHAGKVNADTLHRFRAGMLNANKSPFGRQLLTMWKVTGFEPIPARYEQILSDIAKTYPPPKDLTVAKKR